MKPELEKIIDVGAQSFYSREVVRQNRPLLSAAWHFHPEFEICYTEKSNGKRYVGNDISNYKSSDLVVLGSNLPHGFTTHEECHQFVIQFRYDFLGKSFFQKPELISLRKMLQLSSMGLEIGEKSKEKAIPLIKDITKSEGLDRIIKILELLNVLSSPGNFKTICAKEYSLSININQLSRIKRVFDFIENNFQKQITISDAAKEINLTNSAFYKFIVRHTKKKFTKILNEYRVNHASNKLITTRMTISQICFDSGYKNLSYFNRKFKEIMGETPKNFRLKYR